MYHLDFFFDRGSNISKEIPFFGVFSTKGQGRTEEQLQVIYRYVKWMTKQILRWKKINRDEKF